MPFVNNRHCDNPLLKDAFFSQAPDKAVTGLDWQFCKGASRSIAISVVGTLSPSLSCRFAATNHGFTWVTFLSISIILLRLLELSWNTFPSTLAFPSQSPYQPTSFIKLSDAPTRCWAAAGQVLFSRTRLAVKPKQHVHIPKTKLTATPGNTKLEKTVFLRCRC